MDFAKHENENTTMEQIYSRWPFPLSPFQKIAINAKRKSEIPTAPFFSPPPN